jgi:cell wall-associated NlpC family hydrolase
MMIFSQDFQIGKNTIEYKGSYVPFEKLTTKENLLNIAEPYLNTAYLWGGKSIFGIDCSGFVQQVYKMLGIVLPRDAYQQATVGESVGFLEEVQLGDLAYFDNAERRITHVGIMLNSHQIIHASGKVRIDNIDNMGIVNSDTELRTHQLRMIKRI